MDSFMEEYGTNLDAEKYLDDFDLKSWNVPSNSIFNKYADL
jgi:hypothetical protein